MSRFIEPISYKHEVELFVDMYFKNMFKGKIEIEIEYELRSVTYCIAVVHTYNNIRSCVKGSISCMFTTDKILDTLQQMKECIIEDYKSKLAETQNPLW